MNGIVKINVLTTNVFFNMIVISMEVFSFYSQLCLDILVLIK